MSAVTRAAVALALVAAPLAAQAPGLPVHGGGFRSGVEVIATVGWAGASSLVGDATTWAGSVAYGTGRLGLSGTLGTVDSEARGHAEPTLGVLASFRLLGNSVDTPFEVSAFAGYGWWGPPGEEVTLPGGLLLREPLVGTPGNWRVPVGASFVVAITTPIASVRPWLAPRAEIFRLTGSDTVEDRIQLAGSAGVDLWFAGGPGVRVMWDHVDGLDQTIGLGLSYRF